MRNLIIATIIYTLTGCSQFQPKSNNATKHCIQRGGEIVMMKRSVIDATYCKLPNGSFVEVWRLYLKDYIFQ